MDHCVFIQANDKRMLGAIVAEYTLRRHSSNRDDPQIDKPTNYDPRDLDYGASFKQLLKELDSPEFERHVAKKFAVDLTGRPGVLMCAEGIMVIGRQVKFRLSRFSARCL